MSAAVSELLSILDLEEIDTNLYRGLSPQVGWQRVFGGLVISQALVAAMRTVEERQPHSLHGYFLLPGDPARPILYDVDRIRDGRSFATRRVVARQRGAAIFAMSASFQTAEAGHEHQLAMPDVQPPEELLSDKEIAERFGDRLPASVVRYLQRERPIELRPVSLDRYQAAGTRASGQAPTQAVWIRAAGALPPDPRIHLAVLAYASDMTLLDTSLVAHGKSVFDPDIQAASLDHAMWLHRPVKIDDWLLYAQDSPASMAARGFSRGSLFDRSGRLVASVAQEGLIRPRPDRTA
jgi:acyl-CoA thioesterase II